VPSSSTPIPRSPLTALVITASDAAAAGVRPDASGPLVAERLARLGFTAERLVLPDDRASIAAAIVEGAARHRLVVTTGGTGLTPRDVTPQATADVLDYEVPGLAEAMRAEGRRDTPMASLSRGLVGVRGSTLVVNLPGSPKGALQSLEAVVPVLAHALETLAGPFDHRAATAAGRTDLPGADPPSEAAPQEPTSGGSER
jgi:molybdenum cofactor synthesis domain-containing protein